MSGASRGEREAKRPPLLQQQDSEWCRPATNGFSKFHLLQFSDMRLNIFFFFIVRFFQVCLHVFTLLIPVLGSLLPPLFLFLSLSLQVRCFLFIRFLRFSCAGMKMQKTNAAGDNKNREQDS